MQEHPAISLSFPPGNWDSARQKPSISLQAPYLPYFSKKLQFLGNPRLLQGELHKCLSAAAGPVEVGAAGFWCSAVPFLPPHTFPAATAIRSAAPVPNGSSQMRKRQRNCHHRVAAVSVPEFFFQLPLLNVCGALCHGLVEVLGYGLDLLILKVSSILVILWILWIFY